MPQRVRYRALRLRACAMPPSSSCVGSCHGLTWADQRARRQGDLWAEIELSSWSDSLFLPWQTELGLGAAEPSAGAGQLGAKRNRKPPQASDRCIGGVRVRLSSPLVHFFHELKAVASKCRILDNLEVAIGDSRWSGARLKCRSAEAKSCGAHACCATLAHHAAPCGLGIAHRPMAIAHCTWHCNAQRLSFERCETLKERSALQGFRATCPLSYSLFEDKGHKELAYSPQGESARAAERQRGRALPL